MDKSKNYWNSFFNSLPVVREKLEPYAKRSGISVDSAILLTVYADFPDLFLPVKDEFIEELKKVGFIKIEEGNPILTSKGSILSKSFMQIRDANLI